jgi:ubiquitin carboxyl-terminal hydrolase L3
MLPCVTQETQDQVYFIKQIKSLGNACGTIALLHAVGNASSEVNLGNRKQLCAAHRIL